MILALSLSLVACASKEAQGPCKGRSCKTADLLDNTAPKQEWYCYGQSEGGEWQCGKEADETKISEVQPQKNQSQQSISRESLQSKDSEKVVPNKPAPSPIHIVNEKIVAKTSSQKTLASLPASYYAVQIIASTNLAGVKAFSNKVGIQEPIIAHINSRGSDWFVLLLDVYPGYSNAKQAMDEWLKKYPKLTNPWIRQLGPLQASLKTKASE